MDVETFANSISFRFFDPPTGLKWYLRLNHRLARVGISLEQANTKLPADRREARSALRDLCSIPRMSTYALGALVDKAVSAMPAGTAFVNVGVWHGFTFLSGIVNNPGRRCVAIDNFSQFGGPKDEFLSRFNTRKSDTHEFHEMDYEDYFRSKHQGPIGCYIYDGEHSYRNQFCGLELAEPFFVYRCVILVDDTNDEEPRQATLDFMNRTLNKYRLLFDRSTSCNQHPTFWNGVMIFARV